MLAVSTGQRVWGHQYGTRSGAPVIMGPGFAAISTESGLQEVWSCQSGVRIVGAVNAGSGLWEPSPGEQECESRQ